MVGHLDFVVLGHGFHNSLLSFLELDLVFVTLTSGNNREREREGGGGGEGGRERVYDIFCLIRRGFLTL